jgi:hypothetical protein
MRRLWWVFLELMDPSFRAYLREDPHGESRTRVMWCRLRGHPYMKMVGGFYEPTYTCSNCGDEVG